MPAGRGSCCSAGHTCHTLTMPCQDPLARAKRVCFGNRMAPSAHSPFLPAGSGGSEGSTAQLTSEESLQQLPWSHLIHREGQQPPETRTRCSHGPDPSPCGDAHGTSALRAHPLLTRVLQLTATGKARTSDSSEMGLYGVYCSKHFIILQ